MLMAAGLELPKTVFGTRLLDERRREDVEDDRQRHRAAEARDWLAEVSGARREIAVDAVRYFLFREMPLGEDGNFARASLLQRFNSDLANDLGNALNRSLSMTHQKLRGRRSPRHAEETRLRERAAETHARVTAALEALDLQSALAAAGEYVAAINKYLDDRAPWALAKQGKTQELGGVLYHALEAVRVVATWIAPFMPKARRRSGGS
jgi:methionyl-tRNA synthetase